VDDLPRLSNIHITCKEETRGTDILFYDYKGLFADIVSAQLPFVSSLPVLDKEESRLGSVLKRLHTTRKREVQISAWFG